MKYTAHSFDLFSQHLALYTNNAATIFMPGAFSTPAANSCHKPRSLKWLSIEMTLFFIDNNSPNNYSYSMKCSPIKLLPKNITRALKLLVVKFWQLAPFTNRKKFKLKSPYTIEQSFEVPKSGVPNFSNEFFSETLCLGCEHYWYLRTSNAGVVTNVVVHNLKHQFLNPFCNEY